MLCRGARARRAAGPRQVHLAAGRPTGARREAGSAWGRRRGLRLLRGRLCGRSARGSGHHDLSRWRPLRRRAAPLLTGLGKNVWDCAPAGWLAIHSQYRCHLQALIQVARTGSMQLPAPWCYMHPGRKSTAMQPECEGTCQVRLLSAADEHAGSRAPSAPRARRRVGRRRASGLWHVLVPGAGRHVPGRLARRPATRTGLAALRGA